jgi:hypothetical protein
MGTTGYNFCWFHPRKTAGHCDIEFTTTAELREGVLSKLQTGGFDASPRRTDNVTLSVTTKSLDDHAALLTEVLRNAEERSKV